MSMHVKPADLNGTPVKQPAEIVESVVINGDLSHLTPDERIKYYRDVCVAAGLNPLMQPFDYLQLNGKLVLYAKKSCTEQLRVIHGVSVTAIATTQVGDLYVVTANVANSRGRTDAATGVVFTASLKGDALANAYMKAETKAKRRATLSICGLGILDETEIDTISRDTLKAPMITLPKKDAREIYKKLQAEIDASTSRDELRKWAQANARRISIMPPDWKDILRLRYQEMMDDLAQREGAVPESERVIWDENGERRPTASDELETREVIGNFPANAQVPVTAKLEIDPVRMAEILGD